MPSAHTPVNGQKAINEVGTAGSSLGRKKTCQYCSPGIGVMAGVLMVMGVATSVGMVEDEKRKFNVKQLLDCGIMELTTNSNGVWLRGRLQYQINLVMLSCASCIFLSLEEKATSRSCAPNMLFFAPYYASIALYMGF
jgi:hypothetical protein